MKHQSIVDASGSDDSTHADVEINTDIFKILTI